MIRAGATGCNPLDSIGERLMQVTEINSDGLRRDFKVVVPASHLDQRMQDKLTQLAGTISLPGFRPGKVPLAIVRKKYSSAVLGEILEAAVNDAIGKAVESSGLRPAAQPKVEITSFAEGTDLEFDLAIEVMPEITLVDFATISLVRDKAIIADAEIDTVLTGIAERNGSTETVERAAASGDVVVIDFLGKLNGEPFPGGAAERYSLKLGSNTFIPGFEDQLIGLSAGDAKVIEVTFPEGYGNESLSGQPATFDITLHEVQASKPAEINDELAKAVGMESLDALKDAIRAEVGRDLTNASRLKVKRALLDALAASHDFPVPVSMVESEFEAIWKQLEEGRKAGQVDPADEGKSDDELKTEYRTLSERRVRLGLLLAEVGRVNEVTVTQDDINRAILNEARAYPGQEHLVLQYYQKNKDAIESLRAPVYEEKVVDFILEKASVTDREVAAEDLRREHAEAEGTATEGADEADEAEGDDSPKPKKRAPRKKSAE